MRTVDFRIRAYRAGDASDLIDVFERSIRTIGPGKYSDLQVAAWIAGRRDPAEWNRRIIPREAYVAERSNGRVIGWIEMEPNGHIDYFYCMPEATRKGIADALYAVLLAGARKLGITSMNVEASGFAESFFRRHGWRLDRRESVQRGGVSIPRARMSRALI